MEEWVLRGSEMVLRQYTVPYKSPYEKVLYGLATRHGLLYGFRSEAMRVVRHHVTALSLRVAGASATAAAADEAHLRPRAVLAVRGVVRPRAAAALEREVAAAAARARGRREHVARLVAPQLRGTVHRRPAACRQ